MDASEKSSWKYLKPQSNKKNNGKVTLGKEYMVRSFVSFTKGKDEKEKVISDNKHLSQGLGFDKPELMTTPAFKINALFCSHGET